MDVAGIVAEGLGDAGQKGDNVVIEFPVQLVDAVGVEGGIRGDAGGGVFGDGAEFRMCVAGGDFDAQPGFVLCRSVQRRPISGRV